MKYSLIIASAAVLVTAAPPAAPQGCAYDSCLWKDKIPAKWKPVATEFCKLLVGPPPPASTKTVGSCTTITQTVTPQPATTTVIESATATISATSTSTAIAVTTETQTSGTSCTETTTTTPTTEISYPRFTPTGNTRRDANEVEARSYGAPLYPDFIKTGCRKPPSLAQVKAACKCFLTPPVVTVSKKPVTKTTTLPAQTQTQTSTALTTTTVTTVEIVTSTQTSTTVVETCTATSTSIAIQGSISNCGAPSGEYATSTTGSITCTQPANAPSGSVNAFHRIEADSTQGTVFEGCIYAGPRSITTPSGGTHQCGASTGTSITSQTDAGSKLTGYTYDGSFSPSFNDYFITRIGTTQQNGNSYWGVLNNGVFTTSGGCGAQVRPGDSSLWQWDAFNLQGLLTLSPQYAVVAGGDPVSLHVTSRSPNGGGSSPFGGATLSGSGGSVQSDSDGNIAFTAPSAPGCYQYKVEGGGNQGRSNAFYLNVVGEFPATIG